MEKMLFFFVKFSIYIRMASFVAVHGHVLFKPNLTALPRHSFKNLEFHLDFFLMFNIFSPL